MSGPQSVEIGVQIDAVLRERLGRVVRDVWMQWSAEQPVIKPSWRVPWEHLTEPEREVDRRIGEALYRLGVLNADAHQPHLPPGGGSDA